MRGSEFAELKAFVAVVERASFARAPDHLGLSPSALSQTIHQLEARLGVQLLNSCCRSSFNLIQSLERWSATIGMAQVCWVMS